MAPLSAVEIAKGTPRDAMKGVTQVTEGVFDTLPLEFLSKKTRATHSFVSFFLGTLVGNFCLLVFLAVVLVVSGTFSYMGVADCNVTDPRQMCQDYDGNDFWAAWWLSWGLHFDPGTQTGVPSDEGGPVKIVAVLFSVFGFVLNLIFLGLFVENVRSLLDSWRRTYGRIVANDHTVVLGWTDKTLFLLGELAEMMTDSEKGGGTIVVLGELEPLEMLLELKIAFPDWNKKWRKVRVRGYRGKPYEVDDLMKVAVYAAERVIVLGCSRKPRVADSQMLTTICALRCLPGARFLTPNTNVIAELKQPQTEPVVLHIGGDMESPNRPVGDAENGLTNQAPQHPLNITPVVGNHATNAIMALAALDPSAGLALLDLMNFSGDQIETISCATFTQKGPTTFGMLRNSFNSATPLGIQTARGTIILAPPDEQPVDEHTSLLVIALDIAQALASSTVAAKQAKRPPRLHRQSTSSRLLAAVIRLSKSRRNNAIASAPVTSPIDIDDPPAAASAIDNAVEALRQKPRCLIFVGWQRGLETLLRLLDARLPPGSEVHILSEQTERHRNFELLQGGLNMDGSAAANKDGIEPDEAGLTNCKLHHVYGYTTDEKAIARLPLATADAAVVVADANEDPLQDEALGGAELQIADSEALTSTILLRRLRIDVERKAYANDDEPPPLTIVTEFVDLLTRRLLERQSDLINCAPRAPAARAGRGSPVSPGGRRSRAAVAESPRSPRPLVKADPDAPANNAEVQSVVFHRNYIETTALSLAAHSNTSWTTVQMLLDPFSGYEITSVRVVDAVPQDKFTVRQSPTPASQDPDTVRRFAESPEPAPDGATASPERSRRQTRELVGEAWFSFADLSDLMVALQVGLLIGWRRDRGEVFINPSDKIKSLLWNDDDMLILLRRTKYAAGVSVVSRPPRTI